VDSVLNTLDLRAQIGQMILVYHSPCSLLAAHGVGGVLIMQGMLKKPEALRDELAATQKKLAVPLLITIDQEGGTVNRLAPLTRWTHTPPASRYSSWTPDSVTAYWSEVARELAGLHINTNLAPVLDPSVNCRGRPTYVAQRDRALGTGAAQIVPPATAFARAFTNKGLVCIAKHFPGYDAETNSDHDLAHSNADSACLDSSAASFTALAGMVAGVMMSSIVYRSVSDTPAVFSGQMVAWARRAMRDSIVVMTDDLWGTALRAYGLPGAAIHPVEYPDSAFAGLVRRAVAAGNDILMITFPRKVPLMVSTIEAMAQQSDETRAHVRAAARRVLLAKQAAGLL